jgi:hypothetical protein
LPILSFKERTLAWESGWGASAIACYTPRNKENALENWQEAAAFFVVFLVFPVLHYFSPTLAPVAVVVGAILTIAGLWKSWFRKGR